MKKALSLGIITLLLALCPGQSITATPQPAAPATSKALFIYTWYYDYDAYYPVGTTNTVNGEMQRLRNANPGYTFSATPAWGLHEYEYGFFLFFPIAIIYSDLP
ncbi:MAG: hypothetical protein J7621_04425 [Niastella sp.]|nr:hypothetical protein [Niastella sp.]